MAKRKRSVDDSPLSVSSYNAFSTPEAQSPIPFPDNFNGSSHMDIDSSSRHNGWDFASASRVKSGDWGNRTRKRVRDNRPDEQSIHRKTFTFGHMTIDVNCDQKLHYRSCSRHNAPTHQPYPFLPTPHQHNNLPWQFLSPKNQHSIRSGNSYRLHPCSPSSPSHRLSSSTHIFLAATTVIRHCTAQTTAWTSIWTWAAP